MSYCIVAISNGGGAPEQAYRKLQSAGACPENPYAGKKKDPLSAVEARRSLYCSPKKVPSRHGAVFAMTCLANFSLLCTVLM
jgi:hypothetical protein